MVQHEKTYNRISDRLKEQSAMTLTEMLAALLILSMTAVAIAGGVTAVKNAYQKVTRKAEAQQILTTTAELMTDEFASALEEQDGGTDGWDFLSGKNGSWMHFETDPEQGVCKVYGDSAVCVPLLSTAAMGKRFYTDYDSYIYEDGCFKVRNLAVYDRNGDAGREERIPAASLSELVVRAVNLEDTQS